MDMGTRRGKLREHTAAELRGLLAKRRISASEFARRVGWSQPYMARRYDGRVAMDIDDLEVIANELGIEVADLFGPGRSQTTEAKLRVPERTMPAAQTRTAQPIGRTPHAVNPTRRRPARIGAHPAATPTRAVTRG